MNLKFNFKDFQALDKDFEASKRAIPIIAQRVLNEHLRRLRSEMRPQIPSKSGALRRSFGVSVRRRTALVTGRLGFFSGKGVTAGTAIAANVLQKGGATPRKGKYLWIPLPPNRAADGGGLMSPRQLLDSGGFVKRSAGGNMIAFTESGMPAFVLKTFVKLPAPPLPIEGRVEGELPQITGDIEETIKGTIEAKKVFESGG